MSLQKQKSEHWLLRKERFSDGACGVAHEGTESRSHKDETNVEYKNPLFGGSVIIALSSRCLHPKKEALQSQSCRLVESNQELVSEFCETFVSLCVNFEQSSIETSCRTEHGLGTARGLWSLFSVRVNTRPLSLYLRV